MNPRRKDSCCDLNASDNAFGSSYFSKYTGTRAHDFRGGSPVPLSATAEVGLRPSTVRRLEKMQMLLAELALRQMQAEDISEFLNASSTCVRNYIRDLRDARVIETEPKLQGMLKVRRPFYRLSSEPDHARAFLADISKSEREGNVFAKPGSLGRRGKIVVENKRYFHIMADDVYFPIRVECMPVRRDPLVAALFGSALTRVEAMP